MEIFKKKVVRGAEEEEGGREKRAKERRRKEGSREQQTELTRLPGKAPERGKKFCKNVEGKERGRKSRRGAGWVGG